MPTPQLPPNAPFDDDQRAWMNGYLEGFFNAESLFKNGGSQQGGTALASAPPAPAGLPVTILWGSQTGTSESLAKKAAKKLQAAGHDPKVIDIADYEISSLSSESQLLVITSTYGDGEAPDNATVFHETLMASSEPKMENVHYSILALGDTEYVDFCKCGKDLDQAFTARGAKTLSPRVDVDVDPDDPFKEWLTAVLESLATLKS